MGELRNCVKKFVAGVGTLVKSGSFTQHAEEDKGARPTLTMNYIMGGTVLLFGIARAYNLSAPPHM